MKNIKNYRSAIALVKRYRSVTLEEAQKEFEKYFFASSAAGHLTGFGSITTCTLCVEAGQNCAACIYEEGLHSCGCMKGVNMNTYLSIANAEGAEKLVAAMHARAEHIKKVVNTRRKKRIIT